MPRPDPPPPLTLVVGDEPVLVERAVTATVRAIRQTEPDTTVHDLTAAGLPPSAIADALAPSLFGGTTALVVRGTQDATKDLTAALLTAAATPEPGVFLVLTHAGGAKGKALLTSLTGPARTHGTRVDAPKPRPGDRPGLVRQEFRDAGRQVTAEALRLLMEAVGSDLRELFAAASQLVADTAGTVTEDHVAAYYRGRAETSGFAVADAAVAGDLPGALGLARQARGAGVADVLLSSALAGTLRTIGQVGGSRSAADAAAALGVPSWKAEKALRQSRGWTPAGLTVALLAAARLDRDVKGGAADAGWAVERALAAVCRARLDPPADPGRGAFREFGRVTVPSPGGTAADNGG